MEEYEIETLARYEAEQVVENVKEELKTLEGRIADTEMSVEGIERELDDTKSEIAEKLEEAEHALQFCEEGAEVASVLVDLFNEIVKVLKGEER